MSYASEWCSAPLGVKALGLGNNWSPLYHAALLAADSLPHSDVSSDLYMTALAATPGIDL